MLLIFLTLFICVGLGYIYSQTTGLIAYSIAPFLVSLGNLLLINNSIIPLRFHEALFAITLGIILNRENRVLIIKNLNLNFNKELIILITFFIVEIIYGFLRPDSTFLKYTLLYLYPSYFSAIVLGTFITRSINDLILLENVMFITGSIIAILALIEIFTGYNISHYLCFLNLDVCDQKALHWAPKFLVNDIYSPIPRTGNIFLSGRWAGFTGQPNKSAILLAICLIFMINKVVKSYYLNILYIPIVFICIIVLVLSENRASIFSFLILFLLYIWINQKSWIKFLLLIGPIVFLFIFNEDANNWLINHFYKTRLSTVSVVIDNQRVDGLTTAFRIIPTKILGVGGGIYYNLRNTLNDNDTSTFILYFLSGGIILGGLYLCYYCTVILFLFSSIKFFKIDKNNMNIYLSILIAVSTIALCSLFGDYSLFFYVIFFASAAKSAFAGNEKFHRTDYSANSK